jgi:hypothetical protein
MVTVPAVPEVPNAVPDEPAAELLVKPTGEEASLVWLIGRVTVARTPLERVVLFNPHKMQVADPALLLHVSCLFAAVAAGPTAIVAVLKSTVEYPSVHSTEAGSGLARLTLRFNVTALPAAAEPDESPSETGVAP